MVMKFDMHTHTIYSMHKFWGADGIDTPETMVKAAIKAGLDGMAVTDHQTVKGSIEALKYVRGRRLDFQIVTGLEICTENGDVLGLGITEDVKDGLSVAETVDRIHGLGGIAVAAHPFSTFSLRNCIGKRAILTDAVEVMNASSSRAWQDRTALKFALKNGKPVSAGSDAHTWQCIGNAGIICSGDPLKAIMAKKAEVFGVYTPIDQTIYHLYKKFGRSIKWRMKR